MARRARRILLRWPVLLVLVVAVAVGTATDLDRPATGASRMGDLRSFYATVQTGVSSCTGGLHDSLVALTAILDGASTDRATAESIATAGVDACSPASDGELFDMATAAPPVGLVKEGVGAAVNGIYTWCYPAASIAQAQIYRLVLHRYPPGSAQARALYAELVALQASAVRVQDQFFALGRRLGGTLPPITPALSQNAPVALLGPPGAGAAGG